MRFGKAKEDTRPARGGYAPGNYIVVCHGCNEVFVGDKRASQCADCAYAAQQTATCANCRNAGRALCAGCTWTEDASAPSYWRVRPSYGATGCWNVFGKRIKENAHERS